MKNLFLFTIVAIIYFFSPSLQSIHALEFYDLQKNNVIPRACNETAPCPQELQGIYGANCAKDYEDFKSAPNTKHYWIEDPDITAQGQSNERARQFLDWTLNKSAIDNAPVITQVWRTTQGYALFFVVLVAAIFGIGIIVSKKTNFQLNIQVWPSILRIGLMVLFIFFSAAVVLSLIQLSEVIMLFFVENLGGRNLFNIYFSTNGGTLGGSESNYTDFVGCRDLNIRVQEGLGAQLFLLKLTNITYYVMGVMIILRKIILWLMLFVSPFLPLLMPFVLIRNIGWIWIGVFFQWLFYGPLFAIFLGALNTIWKSGIPFQFDFSRAGKVTGYVYPTAMNITYGGPAQIAGRSIGGLNNGNYIDTFVEYVITLIMLWAVTFFPWWLLRIFRDYCCDGIYAMKNILLAMYDQTRSGGPNKPSPTAPHLPSLKANLKIEKEEDIRKTVKITTMEDIKRTQTEDLTKSLNLRVSKLTDIAKLETNKQLHSVVSKNIAYLSNPIKAQNSSDKQQFMNLRTELFNRAVKQDPMARAMLQSTSTSQYERSRSQHELVKDISHMVASSASMGNLATAQMINSVAASLNTSQAAAQKLLQNYTKTTTQSLSTLAKELNISVDKIRATMHTVSQEQQQKVGSVMATYMTKLSTHTSVVEKVAQRTKLSQEDIKRIYQAYAQSTNKPINQVINTISNITNISQAKVQGVLQQTYGMISTRTFITDFATDKKVQSDQVEQAIANVIKTTEKTDVDNPQAAPPEQPTKAEETIIESVVETIAQHEEVVEQVQQATGIKKEEIQKALENYNYTEPQTIVTTVLKVVSENLETSKQIPQEVSEQEQIEAQDAAKVVEQQLEVASAPEQNIEKTVEVPQSISIEEYEEIKQMWTDQYAEGEIPTTENIDTREQWVDQDVVIITNVMNKILSPDETLQQEGLDELGFIIPIFMINNLKGEQLIVYLKAKLEAAKIVKKDLDKEKKLRAKFERELNQKEEDEEELVKIKKPKEAAKQMEMTLDEDQKEKTIEDIGESVKKYEENTASIETTFSPSFEPDEEDPLANIKSKLEEKTQ